MVVVEFRVEWLDCRGLCHFICGYRYGICRPVRMYVPWAAVCTSVSLSSQSFIVHIHIHPHSK